MNTVETSHEFDAPALTSHHSQALPLHHDATSDPSSDRRLSPPSDQLEVTD